MVSKMRCELGLNGMDLLDDPKSREIRIEKYRAMVEQGIPLFEDVA